MSFLVSPPKNRFSVSSLLLFMVPLVVTTVLIAPNRVRWIGAWRFAVDELAAVTFIVGPLIVALAGMFALATTSSSLTGLARSSNKTKGSIVVYVSRRALAPVLGAWTVLLVGVAFVVVARASVGLQGPDLFQVLITYVYVTFCTLLGVTVSVLFPRVIGPLLAALGLFGVQSAALQFSDFEAERGYDLLFPADGLQPTLMTRTFGLLAGQAMFWFAAIALVLGVAFVSKRVMTVSLAAMLVAVVLVVSPQGSAVAVAADSRQESCATVESTRVCVPTIFEYRLATLGDYLRAPVSQLKSEGLEVSRVVINPFDPAANRFFDDGTKQVVLDFDLRSEVTAENVRSSLVYAIVDEYDETLDPTTPFCPYTVAVDEDGAPAEEVPTESAGPDGGPVTVTVAGDLLLWTADVVGESEVTGLIVDEGLTYSQSFEERFVTAGPDERRAELSTMHDRLVRCAEEYGG